MKEVPYGISDFIRIRRNDAYYYVDKTMFLPKLENEASYLFFIRADAVEQIRRYAVAPRVEALRQGTQLHRIIIQFDGCKLHRMDEV